MLLYLNFYNHSSVKIDLVGEKISDGKVKNKKRCLLNVIWNGFYHFHEVKKESKIFILNHLCIYIIILISYNIYYILILKDL